MKKYSLSFCNRALLAAVVATLVFVDRSKAQNTGFLQTGAGPWTYTASENWVGGNINGIWDASLTLTANQAVTFGANTTLDTGLSFYHSGSPVTLRADGTGPYTLTLGGDIRVQTAGNVTITFGGTSSASQGLNVDLGGVTRTFTVIGSGNGGNFGRTLDFRQNVSNGGVVASGAGSGGGLVRFSSASNTLTSLAIEGAEVSFNGAAVSSTNTVNTITGGLTSAVGANTLTLTSSGSRNTTLQAGSFSRAAGSTIIIRGTNLGADPIGTGANSTSIQFTTAPTLSGAGGPVGSTTLSILAGAFGDMNAGGSGFGATAGLLTYDNVVGLRLLTADEYKASITDLQTDLDNVKIANSSGTIAVTNLSAGTTTINSLSLEVTGATGDQGISIGGAAGSVLRLNSGVIYAYQNVTGGSSPANSDAMTIDVPVLDFNGQEAIILVNTRLNSGGSNVSSGGLFINSVISNATGLTIGDGLSTNPNGFVVLGGAEANTYTGNTTINGAIVRLDKSVSNSFGDIVINLGSLYDVGNQIADTASVTINGGAFYLNSSANSGSATSETIANLTMRNGRVSSGSGSGNTFTVLGNADLSGGAINMPTNGKLIVGGTTTLSGGAINVGASNSQTLYNAKATLSGPVNITNTEEGSPAYTPITIASGAAANNLGGQVELSGDLTFTGNANTNTVTIAAPTGSGHRGVLALDGTRVFDIGDGAAAVDLAVQADIIDGTNTGGLTKTGSGVLALEGANTYAGPTTVNAGTLLINGSLASAVTVDGGVFGGTGSVASSVTIGDGGILAPGNSAGVISVGGLTLTGANSTIAMEIGGADIYDQINVTGEVNLDGNGKIEINLLSFVPQPSEIYFLILNDGVDAINGTLFGIAQGETFDAGGYTWQVSYTGDSAGGTFTGGNDLALQVVPEPGTWLLATGGLMALTVLRRRRQR
jgi:autotransporter-associated beta strand protein